MLSLSRAPLIVYILGFTLLHLGSSVKTRTTVTETWSSVDPISTDFRGWDIWTNDGKITSSAYKCPEHSVFTTDGVGYATCCHETDAAPTGTGCQMGVACGHGHDAVIGTMPHNTSSTWTKKCGGGAHCMAQTIWQAFPSIGPTAVDFFCTGDAGVASQIYRESSNTTSSETSRASSTPTTSSASTTSSSEPGSSGHSDEHKSKAWIAGAVIGPVAFVAILAGAAIFFIRRNHEAASVPQALTDAPPDPFDEGALMGDAKPIFPQDQMMTPSGLTGNEVNAHELPATERFELADTQVPHELPARNPS